MNTVKGKPSYNVIYAHMILNKYQMLENINNGYIKTEVRLSIIQWNPGMDHYEYAMKISKKNLHAYQMPFSFNDGGKCCCVEFTDI